MPLDEETYNLIHLFACLFYTCIKGVSQQMEWLLELMGHIRNIAYGGKSEPSGDTSAVCQWAGLRCDADAVFPALSSQR